MTNTNRTVRNTTSALLSHVCLMEKNTDISVPNCSDATSTTDRDHPTTRGGTVYLLSSVEPVKAGGKTLPIPCQTCCTPSGGPE